MFLDTIITISDIKPNKTEYKNLIGTRGYITELDESFNLLIFSEHGLIVLPKVLRYSIKDDKITVETAEEIILLKKEKD